MSELYKLQSTYFVSSTRKLWLRCDEKKRSKVRTSVVDYTKMIKVSLVSPSPSNSREISTTMYRRSRSGDDNGKFGKYGGQFVPELLVTCLKSLEDEYHKAINDPMFQEELSRALRDYVGRETPLYYAKRLTQHYKNKMHGHGPQIYLKREDLNHGGSHKINNAIAQAMLAQSMGCTTIVTATGSGQHGVAAAAAAAKLGLDCVVLMGHLDVQRQPSNVRLIKLLGSKIKMVDGNYRHACSEAVREWIGDIERNYHMSGSVIGPHPSPTMVREFQSVIGKEVRKQALEKWGGKPDILVACVGGGSNAMGLFHEFVDDKEVRLIGIEAAGSGLDSEMHAATLAKGSMGVYHGSMSYLLQDDDGQILGSHSIGVGLECPAVGPEVSYLKDKKRAEFHSVTDEEALHANKRLCKLEGIFPALEASHALAYLEKLCPSLSDDTKVVVCCSGRGDKDVEAVSMFNQLLALSL